MLSHEKIDRIKGKLNKKDIMLYSLQKSVSLNTGYEV